MRLDERLRGAGPGVTVALIVGIAATFLSLKYRASAMLFALLLGMSLHFLAEEGRCRKGIDLASGLFLRTGVALLGLRITVEQVAALGWGAVALMIGAIGVTIAAGIALSRRMGLGEGFGTLSGGAVAICGASAALAIASMLPKHADSDRDASFVVIAVTAFSTLAMIAYPLLAAFAGLDARDAGVFLGGTIHDVAQVVGAGYSVSEEAGHTATVAKLLRVAMLLPVCLGIGLVLHLRGTTVIRSAPLLPGFAVAFAALVAAGSLGWVPAIVAEVGGQASQWLLVVAIAAIGMKTSLKSLTEMGFAPVMLILAETAILAAVVLAAIGWGI